MRGQSSGSGIGRFHQRRKPRNFRRSSGFAARELLAKIVGLLPPCRGFAIALVGEIVGVAREAVDQGDRTSETRRQAEARDGKILGVIYRHELMLKSRLLSAAYVVALIFLASPGGCD
jgi:hypothetical protein